jgi:hypothetical protein
MGFFSRKRKISTKEFCQEFYDQFVFPPELRGIDMWQVGCETFYKSIADADPQFRKVDIVHLTSEMRAIRLEVIGIAWLHHVEVKFALLQSEFTKRYLEEKGASNVWETMEDYNQAIARSTTLGHDPNSRFGRANLAFLYKRRADFFDEWFKSAYAPDAIARAANRFGCETAWKSGAAHTCLSFMLTNRLGCEVNDDARMRIIFILQGFFEGASDSLKNVKIVES